MDIQSLRYDPQLGYVPAVPEPYWVRHWLFWSRPSCYACRIKFRSRQEWENHYVLRHLQEIVITVSTSSVNSGSPPTTYSSPEKKEGKMINFSTRNRPLP